jgi:hypothetical protein
MSHPHMPEGQQPPQYQQPAYQQPVQGYYPPQQGYAYPPMMMVKPKASGLRVAAGIIAFVLALVNLVMVFVMGSMPSSSPGGGPFTGFIGVMLALTVPGAIVGGILALVQMRSPGRAGPVTLLVFAAISALCHLYLAVRLPLNPMVPLFCFAMSAAIAGMLFADLARKGNGREAAR